MNRDELEFAISQYIDGALPEEQRAAMEERLRTDPEAAGIEAEYRKLGEVVARGAGKTPEVRWDRFAECVGQAIDDRSSRPILTIGRVGWAVAASVLVAVGLLSMRGNHSAGPGAPVVAEISVVGPQAEVASGPVVVDVAVSEPAEADAADYVADGLLTRRSVVALDGFTSPNVGQIR
jgi:anti-sigma factor RsiW